MNIKLQSHVANPPASNDLICMWCIPHSELMWRGFLKCISRFQFANGREFAWNHKCVLIIYTIDQIISDIHEQTISINGRYGFCFPFTFLLWSVSVLFPNQQWTSKSLVLIIANDVANYPNAVKGVQLHKYTG